MNLKQVKYFSTLNRSRLLILITLSFVLFLSTNISSQNQFKYTKIGIAFSEKTWNELHSSDQNYFFIQAWELFFLDKKISYSVFTDDGLDSYDFEDMDILILPGTDK